jgi:hypothetical protein
MSGPSHVFYLINFSHTRRCSVCTSTHGHRRTNTCSKSVCVVLSRPGTNTCSKSVCVFLSRPILGSVRSVNQVITSVVSYHRQSHETMLGVCPLTQSPSLFPSSSGTRASALRALCPSPHPSHSIVNSSALFVLKSANP